MVKRSTSTTSYLRPVTKSTSLACRFFQAIFSRQSKRATASLFSTITLKLRFPVCSSPACRPRRTLVHSSVSPSTYAPPRNSSAKDSAQRDADNSFSAPRFSDITPAPALQIIATGGTPMLTSSPVALSLRIARNVLLAVATICICTAPLYAAANKQGYESFIVGNPADAPPSQHLSPGLVLMGG